LVRELAAAGVPARALVRSGDAASWLRDLGIEPIVGAFEDGESLHRALLGAERVFLLSPAGTGAMVHQQLSTSSCVTTPRTTNRHGCEHPKRTATRP
jgi:uncharacterized protein YbjT (DUF2867 family)